MSGAPAAGLRLPKAVQLDFVRAMVESSGLAVHATIEPALDVETAFQLATAHRSVALISPW